MEFYGSLLGMESTGSTEMCIRDSFKGVHVRVQPVFKLHVAAHLVVVQHVGRAERLRGVPLDVYKRQDQNYRANILVMCNVWNEPIILCKFVPE